MASRRPLQSRLSIACSHSAIIAVLLATGGLAGCESGADAVADDPRSGPAAAESAARDAPLPDGAQARSLFGDVLFPPPLEDPLRRDREANLAEAVAERDRNPDDPEAWIWVGRHQAYLGSYRDAVATFTEGVERFPDDARFLRHRGHRHVTLRDFPAAVADLERGISIAGEAMDRTEPDGLPNSRGIPLTTLGFNLWYHRALAEYLQGDWERALASWEATLQVSDNPDLQVTARYWLYLTARRMGDEDRARRALEGVDPEAEIIENASYRDLLLLYRGERTAEELVGETDEALAAVTLLYGIAMHTLLEGDEVAAAARFQEIVDRADQWPAFGYIAAEAELARRAGESGPR